MSLILVFFLLVFPLDMSGYVSLYSCWTPDYCATLHSHPTSPLINITFSVNITFTKKDPGILPEYCQSLNYPLYEIQACQGMGVLDGEVWGKICR